MGSGAKASQQQLRYPLKQEEVGISKCKGANHTMQEAMKGSKRRAGVQLRRSILRSEMEP